MSFCGDCQWGKDGAMNENATKKGDFCVEARLSIGLGIVD